MQLHAIIRDPTNYRIHDLDILRREETAWSEGRNTE